MFLWRAGKNYPRIIIKCILPNRSSDPINFVDVGYNGISPTTGFINNVLNTYINTYIPRAYLLHDAMVKGGYEETFIWTTHPWIINMFLNCPQNFTLSGVTLKVGAIVLDKIFFSTKKY